MHRDYQLSPMAPKVDEILSWIGVALELISATAIFTGIALFDIVRLNDDKFVGKGKQSDIM